MTGEAMIINAAHLMVDPHDFRQRFASKQILI